MSKEKLYIEHESEWYNVFDTYVYMSEIISIVIDDVKYIKSKYKTTTAIQEFYNFIKSNKNKIQLFTY